MNSLPSVTMDYAKKESFVGTKNRVKALLSKVSHVKSVVFNRESNKITYDDNINSYTKSEEDLANNEIRLSLDVVRCRNTNKNNVDSNLIIAYTSSTRSSDKESTSSSSPSVAPWMRSPSRHRSSPSIYQPEHNDFSKGFLNRKNDPETEFDSMLCHGFYRSTSQPQQETLKLSLTPKVATIKPPLIRRS